MHGGVPVVERERIMASFRAGRVDILLLSEVGSEGLDFEFCNVLFNYDLPWNPMRVEQRIGRLDRFGQRHEKIFIYNFEVPGTIETDIFGRLYERLRVFEQSIGELEPVLRDEFADLQRIVLDAKLSDNQRAAQLRRMEVAFEARAKELDEIRASEADLAGLDDLLVEGLQADLDRGKYVGPTEVKRVVSALLSEFAGARLDQANGDLFELVGTQQLARSLLRSQRSSGTSMYTLGELAQHLNDSDPMAVTFDAATASQFGVELVSVGHPLVLTALEHLGKASRLGLARFGRIRLAHCPDGLYCVVLFLLEATGLRPMRELWPVAVEVATGQVKDEVGEAVLVALARGDFMAHTGEPLPDLADAVRTATARALAHMDGVKVMRQESNDRTIDGRLNALSAEVAYKISRARATLDKVRDPRLRRLYEGRIRNLRADQERRAAGLKAKRGVAVVLAPVAVAVVTGET